MPLFSILISCLLDRLMISCLFPIHFPNLLSVCWIGSGSQASFRELFNLSFSSFLGPHIITLEEEEEEDRN